MGETNTHNHINGKLDRGGGELEEEKRLKGKKTSIC